MPPKHKYAMVKGATRKETQHLRKEFERRNAAQIQPYPLEERRGAFNPLAGHEVQPKLVRLTDVQPEEVVWLWKDRIPCGKLTLLEGDPDDGKSTVAYDVAARVSAGRAMPLDNTPRDPAGVIILSAEDGLADTIRPRLEAADADLDRATSAQVVYGRQHGTLS
ncbi:MAG TPA: AAA family ATPase [Candidatus Binatia bacterium]|nr:AAA family ATPase [Candidatus Binatia bacterium]